MAPLFFFFFFAALSSVLDVVEQVRDLLRMKLYLVERMPDTYQLFECLGRHRVVVLLVYCASQRIRNRGNLKLVHLNLVHTLQFRQHFRKVIGMEQRMLHQGFARKLMLFTFTKVTRELRALVKMALYGVMLYGLFAKGTTTYTLRASQRVFQVIPRLHNSVAILAHLVVGYTQKLEQYPHGTERK